MPDRMIDETATNAATRWQRAWALRRWWLYPGLGLLVLIGAATWLAYGHTEEPFEYILF